MNFYYGLAIGAFLGVGIGMIIMGLLAAASRGTPEGIIYENSGETHEPTQPIPH